MGNEEMDRLISMEYEGVYQGWVKIDGYHTSGSIQNWDMDHVGLEI
jgi:hypothetical protein